MKFIIVIICLFTVPLMAGNSVLSFSGMPFKFYGNDIYGIGMGDTGVGDIHRINTNYSNPANVITANNVIFSTGIGMGYTWYLNSANRGYQDDGLYLPYFTIAVPIDNHKLAFSFNSTLSGNIENQQDNVWEDYSYTEKNRLSSSIYKADLIYAYRNNLVNLGFSVNYYIGHRIQYWELDFDSSQLHDVQYEIDKTFRNAGFTLGLNRKFNNLSLGIYYSSKAELEGKAEFKYGHIPYEDDLALDNDLLFEIPASFSGGMSLKFLEKYKMSMDFNYELWEDTDYYTHNSSKISIGLAYDPLSGYGQWYEQIPLRMGLKWRELPFESGGNRITEKALSCGLSIPLKTPNKQIFLALEYSLRGDENENDIRDKSLMFYFGLTGFDIFSKRHKKIEHRYIPEADESF